MNELIHGSIILSKRVRQHAVWSREPMSYGQAWVDLILLANDRPRTVAIGGESIDLKRGQLAWSKRSLEGQWNRSDKWVDRFLEWCRDEAMILINSSRRTTVITILNYDAYQRRDSSTDSGTVSGTESRTKASTDSAQNLELGIGNSEGNSTHRATEIPSDEDVAAFCRDFKDTASAIEGIPEMWWTGWLATCVSSPRPFPRDWKRALVLAHRSDWLNPKSPGYAKARFNISAQAQNPAGEKKPRRERGEILQELSIEQTIAKKTGGNEAAIAALQEELKNAR